MGTLCHSCWFTYQQMVLKIFPGPDYLHSGDGAIWIRHFRAKLCMWLTIWSCCSSIAVPYGDWEGAWYENSFSWLRVCLPVEDAKNVSLLWLSPLSGWGRLTITFFLKRHFVQSRGCCHQNFFGCKRIFFMSNFKLFEPQFNADQSFVGNYGLKMYGFWDTRGQSLLWHHFSEWFFCKNTKKSLWKMMS